MTASKIKNLHVLVGLVKTSVAQVSRIGQAKKLRYSTAMLLILLLMASWFVVNLVFYWYSGAWRLRHQLILLSLPLLLIAALLWLFRETSLFSCMFMGLSLFQLFNLFRIAKSRISELHLRTATKRTFLMLSLYQAIVLLASLIINLIGPLNYRFIAIAVSAGLVIVSLLQLLVLSANLKRIRPIYLRKAVDVRSLPTISVCIPARNETDDLERSLDSIVRSDYPKMEVLVLDDCSATPRTAEIIRSYAHAGVRFISGRPPSQGWLAKNWAYEQLLNEATGEYVIFCGVDIRFNSDSLRQLIGLMLTEHKQMISLLPERTEAGLPLTQAMRYWWELALPRFTFKRPPVLSSCWASARSFLLESGGFKAVKNAIVPEAYFARTAYLMGLYDFMQAGSTIEVLSSKSGLEQKNTAVRVRYPQLKRRPENVFLTLLVELMVLALPFIMVILNTLFKNWWALVLSLLSSFILLVCYYRFVGQIFRRANKLTVILLPIAFIADVWLLLYSMYKYEFSSVVWKERNVCMPVMRLTRQDQ